MVKLYSVSLSDAERLLLQQTIKKGKGSAQTTTRARILLKAHAGPEGTEWTDAKIAEAIEVSRPTVERLRKRAITEGVEAALQDPVRRAVPIVWAARSHTVVATSCGRVRSFVLAWRADELSHPFPRRAERCIVPSRLLQAHVVSSHF